MCNFVDGVLEMLRHVKKTLLKKKACQVGYSSHAEARVDHVTICNFTMWLPEINQSEGMLSDTV